MRKAFFFLGLVLALFSQVLVAVAQPELLQSPKMPATDFNSYRLLNTNINQGLKSVPEAFLKSINYTPDKTQIYDPALIKLGDGVLNATTCWLDVPNNMMELTAQNNILVGSTVGFGKGLVEGLARGACGVADTATLGMFPSKKPLMEPAYKAATPRKEFKVSFISW